MQAAPPGQHQLVAQRATFLPQANQPADPNNLYQQLLPIVRGILQVILQSDFELSYQAVTSFVLNFNWQDNSTISRWLPAHSHNDNVILKGRILEAFAHWMRLKTKDLDYLVDMSQVGRSFIAERLSELKKRLEQACFQSHNYNEVLAEFIHSVVGELLGQDAGCLGSALAGMLLAQRANGEDILAMIEWPTTFLATLVRKLEELQAKISKVVMELYHETGLYTYDDSKNLLMMFFQHYTVETTTGTVEVHDSHSDGSFVDSPFRVNLIDSFGCLMKLLRHLEIVCQASKTSGQEVALAVDFEGVKLHRHGALCLIQMTCSDDPTLVYVLDVHTLGNRAFTVQTPNGTCMKGLLENQHIRKVWFDPRNDVDALYHQFGVMPRGVFDLQLAEVADRRNRGLNVAYVQGLQKCLCQCLALNSEQKVFAERINTLGKSLFEPQNGGRYEVFQSRPLNPVILVYAAHDSRYMLTLYDQYVASIGPRWVARVLTAGDQRCRWALSTEYCIPSSEAPEI